MGGGSAGKVNLFELPSFLSAPPLGSLSSWRDTHPGYAQVEVPTPSREPPTSRVKSIRSFSALQYAAPCKTHSSIRKCSLSLRRLFSLVFSLFGCTSERRWFPDCLLPPPSPWRLCRFSLRCSWESCASSCFCFLSRLVHQAVSLCLFIFSIPASFFRLVCVCACVGVGDSQHVCIVTCALVSVSVCWCVAPGVALLCVSSSDTS